MAKIKFSVAVQTDPVDDGNTISCIFHLKFAFKKVFTFINGTYFMVTLDGYSNCT